MPKEYEEDNTIDFDLDNHVHQGHQLSLQHLISSLFKGFVDKDGIRLRTS